MKPGLSVVYVDAANVEHPAIVTFVVAENDPLTTVDLMYAVDEPAAAMISATGVLSNLVAGGAPYWAPR